MDNALYLDGLADADQPGLNVRRVPGSAGRPTDEEMLAYYTRLIAGNGGTMNGHWEFAIALAGPDGSLAEATIKSPRQFTHVASNKVMDGYPLESIQIDPATGKYVSEMTTDEKDVFWQRVIGRPMMEFVSRNLQQLV